MKLKGYKLNNKYFFSLTFIVLYYMTRFNRRKWKENVGGVPLDEKII